jgi:hypothetical protein
VQDRTIEAFKVYIFRHTILKQLNIYSNIA